MKVDVESTTCVFAARPRWRSPGDLEAELAHVEPRVPQLALFTQRCEQAMDFNGDYMLDRACRMRQRE